MAFLLFLLATLSFAQAPPDAPPDSAVDTPEGPTDPAEGPCAVDRRASIELAWNAIIAALYPEAHRLLIAAEATFSCSPVPAADLSLYLQFRGALAALEGDPERAALYLSSARSLGPLDRRLGTELLAMAEALPEPGAAALTLDRPDVPTLVDGKQAMEAPLPVVAGIHLVQVLGPGDEIAWALPVQVPPGLDVAVETGVLIPGWERDPDTRLDGESRWHPAALVVSGVFAAGAGVLLGLAAQEENRFYATTSVAGADASFVRNHTLAVAAAASGAGSLVALGMVYPW